jgi:hypothetical protein
MTEKRRRGRPPTTGPGTPVCQRWREDEIKQIDDWRRQQEDLPTRPEAIRRLAKMALDKGKGRAR